MLFKKIQLTCFVFFYFTSICYTVQSNENNPGKIDNTAKPVLSLIIRCDHSGLKVGDEIPIIFLIKNEGIVGYTYSDRNYDRSGRMPEYELSAVDEQGEKVPDPRAKWTGGMMGGLGGEGRIASNNSFTKTIALNRWALLTKPGIYQVTGTYYPEGSLSKIISSPIRIKVLPRTDEETGVYINKLSTQLKETKDDQDR
ncbi:MAG: hypothetical protein JW715_01595, partial [Sedimentisphaerales bacterium]|nr:hypothetical protein [Sedimentisphaerales bacterium]